MPAYILAYFQKHKSLIEENLNLCNDPGDVEAIHNLRLSIKRIRVVGRLADLLSNNTFDTKSTSGGISKLFKRAGRLRDVQVIGQLLVDFQNKDLDPVIEMFTRRETKQRLKFEQALAAFRKDTLENYEENLVNVLNSTSSRQALMAGQKLLSALEIEIHELFHGSTHEKRLHDIRTRLKDINYLNNIFDEQLPVQEQLHISVERLRELGELAGSWHDHLNLEKKIRKFIRKSPSEKSTGSLSDIVVELKQKKQELYQEYVCILINEVKI
ncbi:MAG: CHAD domain-containing protein [Bacteroidales bacterium]|nr:CHAD domain-containing protein [Bacteroidales bacterium]